MTIYVYVQSRGIGQDNDYCWLREDSQERQERVAKPDPVKKIQHLIDSQVQSLILSREDSGELLLLVTGFKARERKDFRGRPIRNSVAWIDDDERVLRAIAVRALQSFRGEDDSLNDIISKAIQPDTTEGFKVEFEALAAKKLAKDVKVENEKPNPKEKIGRADTRAIELEEELKQYKLPETKGALVVFTGIKNQSALEDAKVWRGLSSLVEEENWDESQTLPALGQIFNFCKSLIQADKWGQIGGIISLFVLFILIVPNPLVPTLKSNICKPFVNPQDNSNFLQPWCGSSNHLNNADTLENIIAATTAATTAPTTAVTIAATTAAHEADSSNTSQTPQPLSKKSEITEKSSGKLQVIIGRTQLTMQRDEVLKILATRQEKLKALGVKSLNLFGSVARNEARPDSDVDFLVEFSIEAGSVDQLLVQHSLEDILKCSVDWGTKDALKEHLREPVLKEAIRVF